MSVELNLHNTTILVLTSYKPVTTSEFHLAQAIPTDNSDPSCLFLICGLSFDTVVGSENDLLLVVPGKSCFLCLKDSPSLHREKSAANEITR